VETLPVRFMNESALVLVRKLPTNKTVKALKATKLEGIDGKDKRKRFIECTA
jgi:hypothetical protein